MQLGVRLVLRRVIINEVAGGELEHTGPNEYPEDGQGTRTCAGYASTVISNEGNPVTIGGPANAMNELSKWVGAYTLPTSTVGLWMLLTDCFAPSGPMGVASVGTVCQMPSTVTYVDSGRPPFSADDPCVRMGIGFDSATNCADGRVNDAYPACSLGSEACMGNTGVANDGPDLSETFAHEVR